MDEKETAGGKSGSSWMVKAGWIAALAAAVGIVLVLKAKGPGGEEGKAPEAALTGAPQERESSLRGGKPEAGTNGKDVAEKGRKEASAAPGTASALPTLVDLGSVECIPCKMMFPVLDELGKEYGGKLNVRFIDVKKDTAAAKRYGVRVIPTQVFLDASGKELFRHVGFFPKADILKRWRELGVDLGGG